MNAKTIIQKKVIVLSQSLPPITQAQQEWGYEHILDKMMYYTKNSMVCMECGQKMVNPDGLNIGETKVCPNCKSKCNTQFTKQWSYRLTGYYGIMTTCKDFQVIRMFWIAKFGKVGYKVHNTCMEVMQHWISEGNKSVYVAKQVNGMSACYDLWSYASNLEIRSTGSYAQNLRFRLQPYKWFPKKEILPQIKRNGFKNEFYKIPPQVFFNLLLNDRKFEILLKSKRSGLIKHYEERPEQLSRVWDSLKITLRNNYLIKDIGIWIDYLDLLRYFKRDLRNPFYICPPDLSHAHDQMVIKKQINNFELANEEYINAKRKFFGLNFSDGEIQIKVLESINEFVKEGAELHHCVFKNEYYSKENSLILSARIGDKPIETIEISLSKLAIEQARGLRNNVTRYHKRIINLVQQNIPQIAQRLTA